MGIEEKVVISSFVISELLQESTSEKDVIGILFGNRREIRQLSVTDSPDPSETIHNEIHIQGCASLSFVLEKSDGKNPSFDTNKHAVVVGLYSIKKGIPETMLFPSVRDRRTFKNLSNILGSNDFKILLLVHSNTNAQKSIHEFNAKSLFHQNSSEFQAVPLSILNLGNGSHVEFKTDSSLCLSAGVLETLADSLGPLNVESLRILGELNSVQERLASQLRYGIQRLSEKEKIRFELQREVEQLRQKVSKMERPPNLPSQLNLENMSSYLEACNVLRRHPDDKLSFEGNGKIASKATTSSSFVLDFQPSPEI